jgi:hypothetical protein
MRRRRRAIRRMKKLAIERKKLQHNKVATCFFDDGQIPFFKLFLSARKADLKKGFQHLVVVLVVVVVVVVGTRVKKSF